MRAVASTPDFITEVMARVLSEHTSLSEFALHESLHASLNDAAGTPVLARMWLTALLVAGWGAERVNSQGA